MTQPHDFFPESQDAMPAVRARVPDHVRLGVFSTGMIVMTGSTEFILDFVQNLGRPYQIVARVIVPHLVLPQFADALATNIELFKGRFGPLPNPRLPGQEGTRAEVVRAEPVAPAPSMPYADPHAPTSFSEGSRPAGESEGTRGGMSATGSGVNTGAVPLGPVSGGEVKSGVEGSSSGAASSGHSGTGSQEGGPPSPALPPASTPSSTPSSSPPPRRPTAQEVYDDLKLPDELLNGKYANAVMIGHGPNEFSFDFITNFYPQSAVSCRVFVGAGQASRILESLRTAWEQTRGRYYPPPPPPTNQG